MQKFAVCKGFRKNDAFTQSATLPTFALCHGSKEVIAQCFPNPSKYAIQDMQLQNEMFEINCNLFYVMINKRIVLRCTKLKRTI